MEFVDGETVAELLQGEKLKPEVVISLVSQIASALDYAHGEGVVHRDIKPSNVIVYGGEKVKVTDFGIAKLMDADATHSGLMMGTPSYMSPEQAMGEDLDGRTDIFSLGVVAFEMLSGQQPFPGNNVTSILYKLVHSDPIHPDNLEVLGLLPDKWHEVFSRVLAKAPSDRYPTAAAFVQSLELCLGSWFGALEGETVVLHEPVLSPAELAKASSSTSDETVFRAAAHSAVSRRDERGNDPGAADASESPFVRTEDGHDSRASPADRDPSLRASETRRARRDHRRSRAGRGAHALRRACERARDGRRNARCGASRSSRYDRHHPEAARSQAIPTADRRRGAPSRRTRRSSLEPVIPRRDGPRTNRRRPDGDAAPVDGKPARLDSAGRSHGFDSKGRSVERARSFSKLCRSERTRFESSAPASSRKSSRPRSPRRPRPLRSTSRSGRSLPKAPAAPKPALFRVRSYPPGARVAIDGRDVGVTPIERLQVDAGSRVVRVLRDGFLPWEDTFRARAGRSETIDAVLTARASEPPPAPPEPEPEPAPAPPRAVEGELVERGSPGVTNPKCIRCPGVPFPDAAKRARIQGSVELSFLIDENGAVSDLQVVESGGEVFDDAVLETVPSWRYEPATKHGVRVKMRWLQRFRFQQGR